MTVCLIDGDVLCHIACETHSQKIVNDVKLTTLDDYEPTDEENEAFLMKAFERLKASLKEILEANFSDSYKMAIGGENNFRKLIYPAYKSNRHGPNVQQNLFVPVLRNLLVEHGMAVQAHGMEADDLLRIWAEEYKEQNTQFVICSVDKDLRMIDGMHWLMRHKKHLVMSKEESMRFYYEQLLSGDPTDAIKGVPKIGPVKAKACLANCETEQDFQEAVQQVYYSAFCHQTPLGKYLWRLELNLTGNLIYLKKHPDDWFSLDSWPSVQLEDISMTKTPKKVKTSEVTDEVEMTMEMALDAVNPASVVGETKWEQAMMFLYENTDDKIHEALGVLLLRNKIPDTEIKAYQMLTKFARHNEDPGPKPTVALPKIAIPKIEPVVVNVTKAPVTVPVVPTVTPPVVTVPQVQVEKVIPKPLAFNLPPAKPVSPAAAAPVVAPAVPPVIKPPQPAIEPDTTVPRPTFSAAWGKKK